MGPHPDLPKLAWEPLHERVYHELKAAIISARFAPGERLTVRAVAGMFGVSPMPVRAAFSRLVAEKAVAALANGTITIPLITRCRFEELIEARLLLEGTTTEKAAVSITDAEIDDLAAIAAALTQAAERDDADAYLEQNQRFKFTIYAAAHSPVLTDLIERLWLQLGPFMRFYRRGIRSQLEIDRHEAALAAMRLRDGNAARRAIETDIADGAKFLVSVAEFAENEGSAA